MPLRTLVSFAALATVTLAAVYSAAVDRGPMGMREELWWEVAAAGHLPGRTAIYAEQRMPEYPDSIRWLAPAFAHVHAVDVRVRRGFWHEEPELSIDVPDFGVTSP